MDVISSDITINALHIWDHKKWQVPLPIVVASFNCVTRDIIICVLSVRAHKKIGRREVHVTSHALVLPAKLGTHTRITSYYKIIIIVSEFEKRGILQQKLIF